MSSSDVTGARKGDYIILGTLGAGGMGKVYKVRNTLSDRVERLRPVDVQEIAGAEMFFGYFLQTELLKGFARCIEEFFFLEFGDKLVPERNKEMGIEAGILDLRVS